MLDDMSDAGWAPIHCRRMSYFFFWFSPFESRQSGRDMVFRSGGPGGDDACWMDGWMAGRMGLGSRWLQGLLSLEGFGMQQCKSWWKGMRF